MNTKSEEVGLFNCALVKTTLDDPAAIARRPRGPVIVALPGVLLVSEVNHNWNALNLANAGPVKPIDVLLIVPPVIAGKMVTVPVPVGLKFADTFADVNVRAPVIVVEPTLVNDPSVVVAPVISIIPVLRLSLTSVKRP